MKLYNITQGSKIVCECDDGSAYIVFNNLDGMYSHCTTEKGGAVHLGATAELTKRGDGAYELSESSNN